MKMHHLLTLLAALTLLAGCGASATSQRADARPTDPQEVALPDVSWQASLSRRELGKLELHLWQWLDGDASEDLGSLEDEGSTVRVSVRLRHALYEDEVAHYQRLGLTAAEGDDAPTGQVTRAQLLELARDHNVLELGTAAQVAPAAEATATAQADADTETTAL